MAMSRDQPSSSVPSASPRPRASSAPPPLVPTLEGKPKPPVRSKSAGDLRKTTAQIPSLEDVEMEEMRSVVALESEIGKQMEELRTELAASVAETPHDTLDTEQIREITEESEDRLTISTSTMSQEQLSSSVSETELIPKPRPRARSDPSPTTSALEGKSKPPVRSNSVEELRKTAPLRNLTTQLRHDEETLRRRQLNLEQRDYAVAERERKLKLAEEELESKKGDQEYRLNQERSRLQAWDDMLVIREKDMDDRMFVGHQRELELKMKHQSLDLWALVIEQDKAAIDQRWIYLQQREAVLEKLNHVLHNQQQAQFRYSSDVPDDVSPTYTGLVPQGPPKPIPRRKLVTQELPDSGISSRNVSRPTTITYVPFEEMRRKAPLESEIRKRMEELDAELTSVAATPHDRAPLDYEQISESKKENTQQRGSPPTTTEEGLFRPLPLSAFLGSPPTTMEEGFFRPLSLSLRGVDSVIDEIQFVLTDEERSYNWRDSGFYLHTPRVALLHGVVISVKASLSGQFKFPENSELVSPVYWISTPKIFQFLRPLDLTVDIQHCGTVEERDDSDLSFVVAKCTQPDLPYKFKFLDGGCFVPNSSYGSISVTHFSGLGIVSKQRRSLSYCARTYITNRGGDRWRVHFVIVRDLDIVLKAVDKHYSFARRDVALRVVFKQSKISLDIPEEGKLINEGWKILPRTPPYISKKDADEFRLGQWIPSCELIVEWEKSGQPPVPLRHHVLLIGAKDPRLFFNIAIDPECEENKVKPLPLLQIYQENSKQELCERYPGGLEDKPRLRDLMNEVAAKIPSKWRQFGIELQLSPDELDGFLLASPGDALRCFSSVFTLWQKKMSREPYSWLTVVESLKAPAVGERKLAEELCDELEGAYV